MNSSAAIAAKFGGTSLCDAKHFRQVGEIISTLPNRCYIVPSAPGKRFSSDEKVTDMLYLVCEKAKIGEYSAAKELLFCVEKRFSDIAFELGISDKVDVHSNIEEIAKCFSDSSIPADYYASRGEYLCGLLLAAYLGIEFIDASEIILFDLDGKLLTQKTCRAISRRVSEIDRAVIPGFYGRKITDNSIHTFTRGGSDITGAIVARAVKAEEYRNYTDVSGFFTADPRIVKNAKRIDILSFNELRELSGMGAGVLHESTVVPLLDCCIPIHVLNTNDPNAKGTLIVNDEVCEKCQRQSRKVAGITGKKGYTIVNVKKLSLNEESDFARRTLHVFEACSIPVEHMPLSMDNMSVVTFSDSLIGKHMLLTEELRQVLGDVNVSFIDGIALIAAVSSDLHGSTEFARIFFDSLCKEELQIQLTDSGALSNSFVVGVDENCFEKAINLLYEGFSSVGLI